MTSCTLLLLIVTHFLSFISALNYNWQPATATSASWSNSANWMPNGIPGPGDTVILQDVINCFGSTKCLLTLDGGAHTIASLQYLQDNSYTIYLSGGTLTVTGDMILNGLTMTGVHLISEGSVSYMAGTCDIVGSTWINMGTFVSTYFNLQLTQSKFVNMGVVNVTQIQSGVRDSLDYSQSYINNTGVMNLMLTTDSRFGISMYNSGTFNLWSGRLDFFATELSPAKALFTTWSGQLNLYPSSGGIGWYNGQHNFLSTLTIYNGATFYIYGDTLGDNNATLNTQFSGNMTLEDGYYLIFNAPATITSFDFSGSTVLGSAPIIVQTLTATCDRNCILSNPTIAATNMVIMNAHNYAYGFTVSGNVNIQINGTFDAVGVSIGTEDSSTLTINPSAVLALHAFSSELALRHTFSLAVMCYGALQTLPPVSGSCLGNGIIGQFVTGGVFACPINTTVYCGNEDDNAADLDFAGYTVFQKGFSFTGLGSMALLGVVNTKGNGNNPAKIFNIGYNFTTPVRFVGDVVVNFTADLSFADGFWYNGGQVRGSPGNINLLAGGKHHIGGTLSTGYPTILNTAKIINNGSLDMTAGGGFGCVNRAMLVNNGNVTAGSSFASSAYFLNNGFLLENSIVGANIFENNGVVLPTSTASEPADFRVVGNLILDSNSYINLNVYGNARAFGVDGPYDLFGLFEAQSCKFGGDLHLTFFTSGFTPVVGDQYPLINTPKVTLSSNVGTCTCQFNSITTTGLDTSKFAVGIQYDVGISANSAGGIFVVICAAGNTSCATNVRTQGICPATATSTAILAVTSSATTSSATGTLSATGASSATTSVSSTTGTTTIRSTTQKNTSGNNQPGIFMMIVVSFVLLLFYKLN